VPSLGVALKVYVAGLNVPGAAGVAIISAVIVVAVGVALAWAVCE